VDTVGEKNIVTALKGIPGKRLVGEENSPVVGAPEKWSRPSPPHFNAKPPGTNAKEGQACSVQNLGQASNYPNGATEAKRAHLGRSH